MPVNETIHLATIEELHAFLSPVGPKKKFFSAEEQFLFRGEESNQYRLIPSLFRGNIIEALYQSLRLPPLDPAYYQFEETFQWIELKTLVKFFRLANNAGIDLPATESMHPMIVQLSDLYQFQDRSWLPTELLELFSLARHYSLPTRMLDWSDNIYTALYFACSSALRYPERDREDDMVIYALHSAALQKTDFPIRFVRPLRFYNRNAHAQGGVLSYQEPLDVQLEEHFSQKLENSFLYKITIDAKVTLDLYLYLDSLHYSAENIFPDLYGVVRKMMQDDGSWTRRVY